MGYCIPFPISHTPFSSSYFDNTFPAFRGLALAFHFSYCAVLYCTSFSFCLFPVAAFRFPCAVPCGLASSRNRTAKADTPLAADAWHYIDPQVRYRTQGRTDRQTGGGKDGRAGRIDGLVGRAVEQTDGRAGVGRRGGLEVRPCQGYGMGLVGSLGCGYVRRWRCSWKVGLGWWGVRIGWCTGGGLTISHRPCPVTNAHTARQPHTPTS